MQDACWRPTDGDRTARIARPRSVPRRPRTAGAVVLERRVESPWSRDALDLSAPEPPASIAPLPPPDDRGPHRAISVPRQPPSSRRIGVAAMGAAVVLVVAVAFAAASALVPPAAYRPVDVVPAGATARWRVDVGAPVGRDAFAADGERVALLVDDSVLVLDAASGSALWRREIDSGESSVAVLDGVVVTVVAAPDATAVSGFDASSGARLWSWRRRNSTVSITADGMVERVEWPQSTAIRVLDPRSGAPVSPAVEALALLPSPGFTAGGVASGVAVLDVTSGEVVGWSTSDDDVRAVAVVGDRTVALTTDELVLSSRGGQPVDRHPLPSTVGTEVTLVSAGSDRSIGVVSGDTSFGFVVEDDRIDVIWALDARLSPPVDTHAGPLAVARLASGDVALADIRTGSVVTTVGSPDRSEPVLAFDGYVVLPSADGERVRAYDLDGRLRWSTAGEPGSWLALVGGTLYVVGADGTVTARR